MLFNSMPRAEKRVKAVHDVVACHGRDAHRDSLPLRHVEHRIFTGGRIHTARVGDHADAPRFQIGQHTGDHVDKIARISCLGIARPLLLQDRHGHLGKIVERQIIDGPAPHLFHGCFERVAPEALSIRNSDHLFFTRCDGCLGFDMQPDRLGSGVRVLLAGSRFNRA